MKTENIIIIVLWIFVITSVILLFNIDVFFSFGIIGLIITTLSNLKFKDFSITFLVIILLLGSINVIKFSIVIGLNFSIRNIPILNIPSFLMLLILLYNKWNYFSNLNDIWFGKSKEEMIEKRNKQIIFFKEKFSTLTKEELSKKLDSNLANEAKIAINQLLEK